MSVVIYEDLIQGSEEWIEVRRGLLTASEMKNIITPAKLKYANSEKCRSFVCELAAQRVTGFVEPAYVNDDMLRGHEDEAEARRLYHMNYAPVRQVGFVTNNKWDFTIGYSPDFLVGDDGQAEVKSRRQKYQFETIAVDEMPSEYTIQVQTGLLVTERKWCDFISYNGGMLMFTKQVAADKEVQSAIVEAAAKFHEQLDGLILKYARRLADKSARLLPTVRRVALSDEITI